MEYGSIERELRIEASPATVFEVISSAEHVAQWWADEAVIEPVVGSTGELVFGDRSAPDTHVPQLTVVEVEQDRRFAFRWTRPAGEVAREGNSLLVTFELEPDGDGTLLRMTETGFREMGWEVAVLEQTYQEHVGGWAHYLPRLADHAAKVGAGV